MKTFKYHPEVIDPKLVTEEWMESRLADLLRLRPEGVQVVELGYETQFDRTIDENGDPGEYIQVWISWEEEC